MKDAVYLVITRKGVKRLNTKLKPFLSKDEYAIKLNVTVPDAYFDQAIPVANLTVSEGSLVMAPIDVTTEPAL
jgi:hypothetical protein